MSSVEEQPLPAAIHLRPWVASVGFVRSPAQARRREALYLPVAEASLLVRWSAEGEATAQVIGPLTRARRKVFGAPPLYVRVAIGAGRARALLGAPLHELADRVVPLADLWGAEGREARAMLSRRSPPPGRGVPLSPEEAARLVESLLARRLQAVDAPAPRRTLVTRAMQLLANDEARVAAVTRVLRVSERHLLRLFRDELGMSPKRYARIVRARRALALSVSGAEPAWAQLAIDTGFHDQSHFIRDHRELFATTPERLLRERSPR